MLKHVLAALTAVVLTACAAAPEKIASGAPQATPASTPEAALRARVAAYYAALMADQYEAAYGFFPPGYRETWSAQAYYQIHPPVGKYLSVDPLSVKCASETVCDVVVSVRFRFAERQEVLGGIEVPMDVSSRWLNVAGEWYFVPPA